MTRTSLWFAGLSALTLSTTACAGFKSNQLTLSNSASSVVSTPTGSNSVGAPSSGNPSSNSGAASGPTSGSTAGGTSGSSGNGNGSGNGNTSSGNGNNTGNGGGGTVAGSGSGVTYYVSPSGSDSNAGTSQSAPWKTVAKVAAMKFGAGDSVLFQGGQSFTGCLAFTSSNLTSTAAKPFTLGAYGSGSFTLLSNCPGKASSNEGPRNPLINLTSVNGFVLQDCVLSGNGTGTQYGVLITNPGAQVTGGITIQRCEFKDFNTTFASDTAAHIEIQGYPGPENLGLQNITIVGNTFHGVNGAKSTDDSAISGWGYGTNVSNVSFKNNLVYDMGGHASTFAAGIAFNGWSNGVVDGNVVHDVGGNNLNLCGGPSGILGANSTQVTVQNNEVYNTQPLGSGGGCDWVGIDLDIQVANSTVQYNYVHDNYGAGLLAYAGNGVDGDNNVFRYNVLVNNASQSGEASFRISGWSNDISNLQVYNNTIYNDQNGAVSVTVADSGVGNISGLFSNNIFFNKNSSKFMVIPYNTASLSGLKFNNNDYFSNSGFSFQWTNKTYSSFASLVSGSGFEAAGKNVNPLLVNAAPVGVTNGVVPSKLAGFQLQSSSPLRGAGVKTSASVDFFGQTAANSIGASN